MKTKVVPLNNGSKVILYKNEMTGEWLKDKSKASDNFQKYIIESNEKKARTIRQYYSGITISYTRNKIREMINNDIKNIDSLYDTIVNEIILKRK